MTLTVILRMRESSSVPAVRRSFGRLFRLTLLMFSVRVRASVGRVSHSSRSCGFRRSTRGQGQHARQIQIWPVEYCVSSKRKITSRR